MNTTVKNLSDTKVQLTITIDATALADAEAVALVKLAKTVKVPGFRKGKVPASIVAKHADPQMLEEQLLNDAISKAVAEAFLAEKVQAIDRPMVDIKKYIPHDILEFTAEVEVLPKVTLGDYKKLNKKLDSVTVSKAEIDDVIERMRNGFADKKEVKRPAKIGDDTVIDFVGKKNGIAFDGGTGTDYTLTLGSGQFIPGFEEGVVGHKAGETFDINLSFPDDYHAKELAGQAVVFTTTLKKVSEKKLPELNDDFAKKTGDAETLEELRSNIKAEITTKKEQDARDKLRNDLLDALVEKSTVPVPDALIDDQVRSLEQDFMQNLAYRGLTLSSYLEVNNFKNEDEWREKELRPTALKRAQAGLVLNELSNVEHITATNEQIDEHVEVHKQQYANNADALKQFESEEVRRDIANHYITELTIDRLVELNSK